MMVVTIWLFSITIKFFLKTDIRFIQRRGLTVCLGIGHLLIGHFSQWLDHLLELFFVGDNLPSSLALKSSTAFKNFLSHFSSGACMREHYSAACFENTATERVRVGAHIARGGTESMI